MNPAAKALGVEPGEERSVALMTAHSFFMGCATVFFETAASAFFLSRFESHVIPWVYLAAAVVNTFTGAVYSRVQERVSFGWLMKGTLWFLFITVLLVRLGFAVSSAGWVVFGGLVWYRVISSLTDLEYWAVASRIYDVRQAKRLFGLVGTGEVVARTAGAFSVPLVVKAAGVGNLMLLSALGLGASLLLLSRVLRLSPAADPPAEAREPRRAGSGVRAGLRQIADSPYLTLVVGVAVLATFGKYFVDFAFLEQMSTHSKVEGELAGYLGLFSGLTQTLSLLTRLLVSRPLLSRFGIRVGVMVLPLMQLACTAAIVASGVLGAPAGLVFWLVLGNQGIYKTFKHPIDNASFKVLYQPLRPEQRLSAQIAVEVVFAPVVVGVAGAIMLLFSAGMRYDPARFAVVLLVNFALWALLARRAGRAYMRALVAMLRRRIEHHEPLDLSDGTTLSALRERLDSPSPVEVWFALHLLEKAGAPGLVEALASRVTHPAPEVRSYAVERLLALKPDALSPLRARLSLDPAPSVRRAALAAFAARAGAGAVDELLPHLDDPDPIVQRAAVARLFALGDPRARAAAAGAVQRLSRSDRERDRELGARLAGEHGLEAILPPLLSDEAPCVRRAALAAAGKTRSPALRPALLRHLGDPHFAETAVSALSLEGGAILPDLRALFDPAANRLLLSRLVRIHALVGGPAAIANLAEQLEFPDPGVRAEVLAALDTLGFVAEGEGRARLSRLVRDEVREAAVTLGALRDLGGDPPLLALCGALEDEVALARRRLFSAMACLYDRTAVHRARDHIAHPSKDKRAYAQEVFDLVLPREERGLLLPMLDVASARERLGRLEPLFPQPPATRSARLRELIERPAPHLRGFTRALAIRAAAGSPGAGLGAVIARVRSTDPLVQEAAAAAGEGPGGVTAKEGRAMLKIEKIILLKTVPMFTETSEELLADIAAILEEIECRAGDTIFRKGDGGDSMYIVVTGRVRVFDGDSTLSVLGEREIFGELALLDPEPRSASVAALEDARLFRLDRETFSQLMAGNLEIVRGVLHVLCERLRRTSAAASGRSLVQVPRFSGLAFVEKSGVNLPVTPVGRRVWCS